MDDERHARRIGGRQRHGRLASGLPTGLIFGLMSLAACGEDAATADAGPEPLVTEGGTLRVESCGYDVQTRVGATAPAPGEAVHGADPTPKQLRLGLRGDAARSIVVQWRTGDDDTLASTVQYGEGDALDQEIEGLTFVYVGGFNQNGEPVRMHEAHLCGLEPDTRYSYRVGGRDAAGNEVWSETFSFHTAPDPSTQPDAEIVIAALGDSRDGYDIWAQMVELLGSEAPDVILFSGDAVTVGAVQAEWDVFFDVGEPLLARAPVIAAHGNHELNAINYYAQFALPGDEENFGLDYGPVHLTVVNDSPENPADIEGRLADFLQADLAANVDAPWKLMMHHRSLWSSSTRHGSATELQDAWQPIIDAHEVDLIIAGHDHTYERTKPMRGDTPQASPADGTIYVVSGGAGAGLYPNGQDFWTEVSESTHSALVLRIGPTTLEMRAVRQDGTLIDELIIDKGAAAAR